MIGAGHFEPTGFQQRFENGIAELGAVAATCDGHEFADGGIGQAFPEDFDLVPTWCHFFPKPVLMRRLRGGQTPIR